MSMYLSVTIEGRERNKQTGVNVRITGENLYTLPLDYEQTEDLMARLYNYLKAENISDPQITFGKQESGEKCNSICRLFRDYTGDFAAVYWPHKNETMKEEYLKPCKNTVKEWTLYALKFERDPAE